METAARLPMVGGCSSLPPLPPVDQNLNSRSRVMGLFSLRFRQGVIGRFVVQLMPSRATFFLRLREASFSLTSAVDGLTIESCCCFNLCCQSRCFLSRSQAARVPLNPSSPGVYKFEQIRRKALFVRRWISWDVTFHMTRPNSLLLPALLSSCNRFRRSNSWSRCCSSRCRLSSSLRACSSSAARCFAAAARRCRRTPQRSALHSGHFHQFQNDTNCAKEYPFENDQNNLREIALSAENENTIDQIPI